MRGNPKPKIAKLMALVTRIAGNFYKAIGDSESASYFKKSLT